MKFKKVFQKAAALVMAAVTALSVIPATTAFAATGDIGTISFSHTYDGNGNAMRYNSSANIGGYTAGGAGNYKYRMFVGGDVAFCIQPGVPLKTGNTLKEASSETWNALSDSQKKAVGLALLYGYQGNRSNLTGSDDEKWLATQTLVWEFVTGCREATGSYRKTSDTVYKLHFGSNYPNSGARAAYDQIVSLMSSHNTIPSFMSGGKADITKELAYKDGKYSLTLTDNNGVLSDYSFASSSGAVSVSKSGNKLTITSDKAFDGSVRITATRNGVPTVSSSAKLIAYGDPNLQDLITGVENANPVSAYLNVETPTGTIALKKTSEDGVIAGIQFTIKGEGVNKTVTTDENGNLTVEGLLSILFGLLQTASFIGVKKEKKMNYTEWAFHDLEPVYLQLIQKIEYSILRKQLPAGEELPSIRIMAKSLKISPNTVMKAYMRLRKSNLIISSRNGHYSVIDNEQYILQAKDEKVRELCISYLSNMINLGFSKKEATDFLIEYSSKLKEPNK